MSPPIHLSSQLTNLLTQQRKGQKQKSIGTTISQIYDPYHLLKSPPKPSEVTLELLLASQTHLGHTTSRWNPQNSRYIFGIREGVHIISLDVTAAYLRRAAKIVEEVARRGGEDVQERGREGLQPQLKPSGGRALDRPAPAAPPAAQRL